MRVLITGAGGQVGLALLNSKPATVNVRALTRVQLDITDRRAVNLAVRAFQPDLVVNAAAYTAVDRAESEPSLAQAVNVQGTRHLAEAARGTPGCRLLQLSTDYVFDGRASVAYRADATSRPLSVYGRTKLAAEEAVFEVLGERSVVMRTAWVYAPYGQNFLLSMLHLMQERATVRVVSDQRGHPTAAASVAQAVWRLAERPLTGILQWTDAGVASRFEFAQAIAEEAGSMGLLFHSIRVVPIRSAEYPTVARRPRYSVLDIHESAESLDLRPVPWRTNLRATLRVLARQGR